MAKLLVTLLVFIGLLPLAINATQTQPNVVIILADDLGYGDVKAYNPTSKIPTPNIDSLAAGGIRFIDGHSSASVCTPTRYSLLTGRYSFRSRLKKGVTYGYAPPLISDDEQTIAKVFKNAGYHTAAIGKWHLGMQLPIQNLDKHATFDRVKGDTKGEVIVDWSKPITAGPNTLGFDYFYGSLASLDMPPYLYIENNKVTQVPTKWAPRLKFPMYARAGEISDDFSPAEVGYRYAAKAATYIHKQAKSDKPFFLYLPLTGPHKPILTEGGSKAMPSFNGKTKLGQYGDFVALTDYWVGQVITALKQAGIDDNTLVVFASDNGSYMYSLPDKREDHSVKSSIQGYHPDSHKSSGIYRGTKADIYEGGHRVPFILHWPNKFQAQVADGLITTMDLLPTLANLLGLPYQQQNLDGQNMAQDMFRPLTKQHRRMSLMTTSKGVIAARYGYWKLILSHGSGGREKPKGTPFVGPYQLYNLQDDPAEQHNLIEKERALALKLEHQALQIIGADLPSAKQELRKH